MSRIAVQLLAEGFLHSATRLERELVGDDGVLHLPVAGLDADVQFFHCSAQSAPASLAREYVLADAPLPSTRDVAQRFLAQRFAAAAPLFLRSQATGRASVDCTPQAPQLTQDAAACVAMVMYSAAWDESDTIEIEGCGHKHTFEVGLDDTGHWAEPRS